MCIRDSHFPPLCAANSSVCVSRRDNAAGQGRGEKWRVCRAPRAPPLSRTPPTRTGPGGGEHTAYRTSGGEHAVTRLRPRRYPPDAPFRRRSPVSRPMLTRPGAPRQPPVARNRGRSTPNPAHPRGTPPAGRFGRRFGPPVPSRWGDAPGDAKAEQILRPRTSYPLTEKAAAGLLRGASGATRFIKRKPLVSLAIVAVAGAMSALLVRVSEPSSRRPEKEDPGLPD